MCPVSRIFIQSIYINIPESIYWCEKECINVNSFERHQSQAISFSTVPESSFLSIDNPLLVLSEYPI